MKKALLLLLSALSLGACSSTRNTGASVPDDVYYNSSNDVYRTTPGSSTGSTGSSTYDQRPTTSYQENGYNNYGNEQQTTPAQYDNTVTTEQSDVQQQQPDYYSAERSNDGNGNTYVTNNYYYNQDDYYDYAYSARLRRFYSPYYGYNYYDPIYTNSYWYDYSPVNWGVSIYSGYSWWAPTSFYYSPFTYSPGISIGINIGWGVPCYSNWYTPYWNRPWGWGGWYSPIGYNGYWAGYNQGYWNGYNHGYYDGSWGISNPYYYNSFDGNFNYGPRGASVSGNSPRPSGSQVFGTGRMTQSVGDKYVDAVTHGRVTRPAVDDDFRKNPISPNSRPSNRADDLTVPSQGKGLDRPSTIDNDLRPSSRPSSTDNGKQPVASPKDFNGRPGGKPGTVTPRGTEESKPLNPGERFSPQETTPVRPGVKEPTNVRPSNQPKGPTSPRPEEQYNRPSTPVNPTDQKRNNNRSNDLQDRSTPNPRYESGPSRVAPLQSNPKQQEERYSSPNPTYSRPGKTESKTRTESPAKEYRNSEQPRQPSRSYQQQEQRNSRPNMEMPRSRDEQRAPVFQPRNEPKQFSQPGRRR